MNHLVRIATNYTRLIGTIILGVWLVRLLNGGMGKDGLAVFFLMGSSVGVAAMVQDIVRQCMVRELGAAWHSEVPGAFARTYSSALAVTTGVAFLSGGLLALVAVFIDILEIPHYLTWPARIFILSKAVETVFTVALAPPINMYLVTERFVPYNIWMIMNRATYVVAAVWLFLVLDIRGAAEGLVAFGIFGTTAYIIVMVVNALMITGRTPGMVPSLKLVTAADMKSIFRIGGWNTSVVVANNLHLRADAIIMNLFFALSGSFAFGLAMQYTSYVRRLAVGLTDGLDAVSVRLSSKGEDTTSVIGLLHQTTRLQAFVSIPCGIVMVYFADPLLRAWLANRQDALDAIPGVLAINALMAIGITVRAVTDGWTRILYGSGHIKRYAPWVIAGGLFNIALAVVLCIVLPGGDGVGSLAVLGPTIAFSLAYLIFHLIALPFIIAKCYSITPWQVVAPIVPSALISVVAAPVLYLVREFTTAPEIIRVLIASLVYALVVGAGFWVFGLSAQERRRLVRMPGKILKRSRARRVAGDEGPASSG